MVKTENKDFKLKVKQIGSEGEFEGYAAVFSNVDLAGDVIEPGAFTKTLQENKVIPILWQHKQDEPIGVTTEIMQDDYGLHVKGQLNLNTTRGREAYELLKQGAIKGLSIGYETVKETWINGIRHIKEIRLWEYSLVTFPANVEARVVAVKSVVPYQALPLADPMTEWDGQAAVQRVLRWAGGPDKENVDFNKFRKAFLWYDDTAPDNITSYKLPIADVIAGKLIAVPRAIYAAAAAIQGARGGVDVPETDIPAIKRHLERYYARLNRVAPWQESKAGRVLSRQNEQLIRQAIAALEALLAEVEPPDTGTPEGQEPQDKALEQIASEIKEILKQL